MKEGQIRVAHILGKMVGGGVEAFIMNYYRHIDKEKVQFDFIIDSDSTVVPREEIEKLGGRIIEIPPYQHIFKYTKELKKVLKENKYKIVHSHLNSLSVFPLYCAWTVKVPVRIAHSHSTTNKKEWKKNLIKRILKPFSKVFATDYFACSEHAGSWLFGNKTFNEGKVTLIYNAIDVEKFRFNNETRSRIRKELNIDDKYVLGHVGRFVKQKNHEFLIEIFNEVHKQNSSAVLLLIGDGPLESNIKQKVKELNLEEQVYFLGVRDNVNEYMQAMDVFVFPSLYEGLGIVAIEAQCSGLRCICSTEVPLEVKVSEQVCFNSIDDINSWKNDILTENTSRVDITENIRNSQYEIAIESRNLLNKYLSLVRPNLVELFGLPGSGKSTFINSIENQDFINLLDKKIYKSNRLFRNLKKILYSLKFINSNKKLNSLLLNEFRKIQFVNNKIKIKMMIYLFSYLYLIDISNKDKKHIYYFDEGILNVIWAIAYNSNAKYENCSNLLNLLKEYIADKVIYLDVSEELIYKRLKERMNVGGSELEHDIKKENYKEILHRAKEIEKMIINQLEKMNIVEIEIRGES